MFDWKIFGRNMAKNDFKGGKNEKLENVLVEVPKSMVMCQSYVKTNFVCKKSKPNQGGDLHKVGVQLEEKIGREPEKMIRWKGNYDSNPEKSPSFFRYNLTFLLVTSLESPICFT